MPSSFQAQGLIEFRVTETKGLRERGKFTSAGLNAQRERNRKTAVETQQRVADLIESRIRWREESTGRLARNTLDPQNITYDTWYIGVGNPSFLDRSTSKYWRTAEEGSAVAWSHPFVGTPLWGRFNKGHLTGFWTDTSGEDNTGKRGHFVVKHETTPLHAYNDATVEAPLRQFAIQNLRRTVEDFFS